MIIALVRSFLGPFAIILDYINANPVVFSIILCIYLGIYVAGVIQLRNIKQKTALMVIQLSQEEIRKKPNITSSGLYKRIYPYWEKEIQKWGLFVPHRLELWPVKVNPDVVKQKMGFNPQWIAETLKNNNIKINENDSLG